VYLAPNMAFSEMNYQSFNTSHELQVSLRTSFLNSMVHIHLTNSTLQHHSVPFSYNRGYQELLALSAKFSITLYPSVVSRDFQQQPGATKNFLALSATFSIILYPSVASRDFQQQPRDTKNFLALTATFSIMMYPSVASK
jgi:hypothetical protein